MEVQEIKKPLFRKDLNPIVTYLNLGTNFPTIHNLQTFHNQGRAPRFFFCLFFIFSFIRRIVIEIGAKPTKLEKVTGYFLMRSMHEFFSK